MYILFLFTYSEELNSFLSSPDIIGVHKRGRTRCAGLAAGMGSVRYVYTRLASKLKRKRRLGKFWKITSEFLSTRLKTA